VSSFLDAFDVDQTKLDVIDEAVRQAPYRNDKRICICGHQMSKHNEETSACKPGRFECPCQRKQAVIEVPDTRYFMSRSLGSGEKHALTRGIFLARQGMGDTFDEKAKWLVDMVCENPACKQETKLYPVRCDLDFFRIYDSSKDQGVTMFYCEDCRAIYTDSNEAIEIKRAALIQKNT